MMTLAERPHAPAVSIMRGNTREKVLSRRINYRKGPDTSSKRDKWTFLAAPGSFFLNCCATYMLLLDHAVRPRRVCLSAKSCTLAPVVSHRARKKRPFGNRRRVGREIAFGAKKVCSL